MVRRLVDTFLLTATVTVTAVERPIGRMRSITLTGPQLGGLSVIAGQQVRIQVGAQNALLDRLVGALRTYSIWSHHDDGLELRIFDHGDGPGAAWARTATIGDEVHVGKPEGTFVTRQAPYHLFVGAVGRLDLPEEPGAAYLAGEAGTIQMVRDHLVRERGWNRRDILTKPFWTPGKTGLE